MFAKLSLLFLIVPLIRALTLGTPSGVTSGGIITVTWTAATGDPTFSLELVNVLFHNSFAIANNVLPSTGSVTLTLPVVPVADGYTIEAVGISNITDVLATSGSFSIGATVSTSTSGSATSSGSSSSGTTTTTTTPLTTTTGTTSGFGTTTTPTTPVSTSGTGTSTSASSTSTKTSAAVPLKFALTGSNIGAIAVAVIAFVGGAATLL